MIIIIITKNKWTFVSKLISMPTRQSHHERQQQASSYSFMFAIIVISQCFIIYAIKMLQHVASNYYLHRITITIIIMIITCRSLLLRVMIITIIYNHDKSNAYLKWLHRQDHDQHFPTPPICTVTLHCRVLENHLSTQAFTVEISPPVMGTTNPTLFEGITSSASLKGHAGPNMSNKRDAYIGISINRQ